MSAVFTFIGMRGYPWRSYIGWATSWTGCRIWTSCQSLI